MFDDQAVSPTIDGSSPPQLKLLLAFPCPIFGTTEEVLYVSCKSPIHYSSGRSIEHAASLELVLQEAVNLPRQLFHCLNVEFGSCWYNYWLQINLYNNTAVGQNDVPTSTNS